MKGNDELIDILKLVKTCSPDFLTTRATSRYNFFTGQTEAEKPPAVWLIIRFLKS